MSAIKDLVMDILELLEKTHFDYEYVANKYRMDPKEVFAIAQDYGDISNDND